MTQARNGGGDLVEVAVPVPLSHAFTYRVPPELREAVVRGQAVRVPFRRKTMVGVVVGPADGEGLKAIRSIESVLDPVYRLSESAIALAERVADYYACAEGEALALFLPPRPGTQARRNPLVVGADKEPEQGPVLTDAQSAALDAVRPAIDDSHFASFLLYGVTGSGKTEVYLRLIQECLDRGRGALVLLPEIALTPQTLRRLRRRFPGKVVPYHSGFSHGERCAAWEAAARGEAPVVVGARSAVFAPVRDLGLIVVDEEHEPSFKSERRPGYHARDVALLRAAAAEVPILLGSATPSLESHHNARAGKHRVLELPDRVGSVGGLPEIRIIDRRREGGAGFEPLSEELVKAVEAALSRGEQAILYHNRRGFARYLQCPDCGDVLECPHCDISLTYHLGGDRLRCHYCDHSRPRPPRCPACDAPTLDPRGTGTQRVELALETTFEGARVLRFDQDTTSRRGSHQQILSRFGRHEADILVGTQMVAKGLHFPKVTVVGVIDADQGMHFPDLRAHERAFQLLTQVAGRSGRRDPGVVILQTRDPEHRVLERVRAHDVKGFLEEEWEQRRALGYPPHRRLAAVTATAPDEARLDRILDAVAGQLRKYLSGNKIRILGPARAALPRINRRYRGQLLLKGALDSAQKRWVLELFDHVRQHEIGGRAVDLVLDIDPLHLL